MEGRKTKPCAGKTATTCQTRKRVEQPIEPDSDECSERTTQTDAVADASFLKKSSSLKLVSLGIFLGVRNDSEYGEFCMNTECRQCR